MTRDLNAVPFQGHTQESGSSIPSEASTEKDRPAQHRATAYLLAHILQRDFLYTLTLTEPWASLIALGAKGNETRSWATSYRGPVGIHASGTLPGEYAALSSQEPFRSALKAGGYFPKDTGYTQSVFPLRHIIAVALLEDIWQITPYNPHRLPDGASAEYAFGNYGIGRYVWQFSACYRLETPIRARGALKLWRWTPPDTFWQEIQDHLDRTREQRKPPFPHAREEEKRW